MSDGSDDIFEFGLDDAIIRTWPEHVYWRGLPPCAILVIGDPPGSMNNESTIQLLDSEGAMIDYVQITNEDSLANLPHVFYSSSAGGSVGIEDEAVSWSSEEQRYIQTTASLGQADCF